jgi:hypothetical protein
MAYDSLPDRSSRFALAPLGTVRMTCECCGFPTLPLAPDALLGEVDWASTVLACPLCSWESGPASEDGTPDPEGGSGEDRNEGFTLAAARANFERHGWMYDPAEPPAWMGGPPTAEETGVRRALREAYEALAGASDPQARGAAWERVLDVESQLRAAEEARRAATEADLEDEGGWDDEDDPTAS